MGSPNIDKYEKIAEQKRLNPNKSLVTLCKEHGVSYQAYYLWNKNRQKANPALEGGQKVNVPVPVSARDMVDHLVSGTSQITIPLADVFRRLSPDDQQKIVVELGKRKLEDTLGPKE